VRSDVKAFSFWGEADILGRRFMSGISPVSDQAFRRGERPVKQGRFIHNLCGSISIGSKPYAFDAGRTGNLILPQFEKT